ncbi:MAG: hypothetical protein AB7N91_32755 [Candidatus Tectimicrobiota bacterium]
MQKPAGTVTLSSAAGEALIAQVRQSNLPPADAGMVAQIIRMYFWVVFALQEAKLSVKRLRTLLLGSSAQPQELSTAGPAATAREPLRPGARGEVPTPVAEGTPGLETAAREAGYGQPPGEGAPTPTGGQQAGTGRLGADASVGAERAQCRHEGWAVGQRCPVCGQGT